MIRMIGLILIVCIQCTIGYPQLDSNIQIAKGDNIIVLHELGDKYFLELEYHTDSITLKHGGFFFKTDSGYKSIGPHFSFNANGNLLYEALFSNYGEVFRYIKYYNNKKVETIAQYINDSTYWEYGFHSGGNIAFAGKVCESKVGVWTYYYSNGIIKKQGSYLKIIVTEENIHDILRNSDFFYGKSISVKDGAWLIFNDDGTKVKKEYYDMGTLIKEEFY